MKNENNLMDSLLKEHAKTKGVDEKFLRELDKKLDAEDRGNVIPLDQASSVSGSSRRGSGLRSGLGLGVGVAACAAIYVGGSMLWKGDSHSEVLALETISSAEQIASAQEDFQKYERPEKLAKDTSSNRSNKESSPAGAGSVVANMEVMESHKAIDSLNEQAPNAIFSAPKQASRERMMKELSRVKRDTLSENSKKNASDLTLRGLSKGGQNSYKLSVAKAGLGGGGAMLFGENRMIEISKSSSGYNAEKYGELIENSFTAPVDKDTQRSTFAIDVDTASYANVRRLITNGNQIPADSVRIEEMVNYFNYQYKKPAPDGEHPFAVHVDAAACPWNENSKLVRIALQGKEIIREERPSSNVVFLLDVSGSMNDATKLPLLKESLKYLLEEMNEKDTISMVVYAGASGLVLPATKMDDAGRMEVIKSMTNLRSGGSTAGGAGIKLAYKIAKENFIEGGVNRVILATDGDFNVGVSDHEELTKIVKGEAKDGVDISVLGFGAGNLNDNMLELITNNGNGNYSYIDTIKEGRKVLLEDMMGTMVTIAKDVKIQVEFNPEKVKEYRLIGYSNRMLPNVAFLDKRVDAGEIGAGHRVTAFYEIVPGKAMDKRKLDGLRYGGEEQNFNAQRPKVAAKHSDELLFVKLAYKQPEQKLNDESTYLSVVLKDEVKTSGQVDNDFEFASSVALFGMVLRDSDHKGNGDLNMVQKLAEAGKGADGRGLREEFVKLVKKMKERDDILRNKE